MIKLKLNNNMRVLLKKDNTYYFKIGQNETSFISNDNEFTSLIDYFLNSGASEEEIHEIISKFKSENTKQRAIQFFYNLFKNNYIDYEIKINEHDKILIKPHHPFCKIIYKNHSLENKKYQISRFSYFHFKDRLGILKNPLSYFDINIQGKFFIDIIISILNGNLADLYKDKLNFYPYIKSFFSILCEGHFIIDQDYQESDSLKGWEFHDLIFHTASRLGKNSDKFKFGATFRNSETQIEFKSNHFQINNLKTIKLAKSSFNLKNDSLSKILINRRSIRTYQKNLISLKELGEFLFRSFAIQKTIPAEPYNLVLKSFPIAGAINDLSLYIVCNLSKDLQKGIYAYNDNEHELYQISQNEEDVDHLIKIARYAWGKENSNPQILLIFTSKFHKMNSKYEGISYRNTLVTVGAAFQTMYLIATSMGLAPCALGSGNSKLFSSMIGLDVFEESSVGEFVLGAL